jgi:hypothetical protein
MTGLSEWHRHLNEKLVLQTQALISLNVINESDEIVTVPERRWSRDQDAHVRLAASHLFGTDPRRNVRPDSEVPKT